MHYRLVVHVLLARLVLPYQPLFVLLQLAERALHRLTPLPPVLKLLPAVAVAAGLLCIFSDAVFGLDEIKQGAGRCCCRQQRPPSSMLLNFLLCCESICIPAVDLHKRGLFNCSRCIQWMKQQRDGCLWWRTPTSDSTTLQRTALMG